jgi:hypothetical protein
VDEVSSGKAKARKTKADLRLAAAQEHVTDTPPPENQRKSKSGSEPALAPTRYMTHSSIVGRHIGD